MKPFRSIIYVTIFFTLQFFCPNSIRSQTKDYPSLLWEISGNGLTKPSYLYGTMHVSKKVAFHLTEAFFEGLKNTDLVALETNPETWLSEIMTEGSALLNTNYFRNLYGGNSNFYEDAFKFKVPGNKFIKLQISKEPENVNSLLYRYNGNSGNFEEYTYLDLFIFQSARKSNKSVIALEDFKTTLIMLSKAYLPDEGKDTHLKRVKRSYDIFEKIEDAYRKGDLDALDSLNKLSNQSKNFEKYMLTDRNVIMANNMDSIMKKQSLFTAIGAAHLPGDKGVINLLKKMGYTVKPVMSNVTKKSIKAMNGLENTHTPLVFKTQFSSDSSFKVDVPGKLFEQKGVDQGDGYLYTDMENGSYYMVRRVRNYGLLVDQDNAYQLRRIDSMLYESIPGKIIRKTPIIANNGDQGFDIINKTRRGDLQRYQIYISDKYISIFKVAGIGNYVKNSTTDKFFKSITFKTERNTDNWIRYSPDAGGYEISLPSNYTVVKPKDSDYQKERISAGNGSDYYLFIRSTLNDYYYIEEDTFELSHLAKGFYESLDFQLNKKEFSTYQSMPCIDISAKKKNSETFLHFRIILKDQQYFMLACKSHQNNVPSAYFNSLKFKEFKHDSMQIYTDTALYYSVSTDFKEKEKSFIESLATISLNNLSKVKKPMPYLRWDEERIIESPATGETVKVFVQKCNDMKMVKSLDDFWKIQTDHYSLKESLEIKEKKKFEKYGIQGLDLVVGDTNSVKQIKTRMYLKNSMLYTMHTTIDSISGTGTWVNTFFETFKPSDSTIGRTIFEDKIDEFLKDAASKDSATQEKVDALCYEVSYEDKHAEQLMKFIGSPDFTNSSIALQSSLISNLGYLKNPNIVPFLKKEYAKYTDSASIQLSILTALANQKTAEANAIFLQALTSDTPLSNSEYEIQNVFSPFYDSLKIAKILFPQLLDITKYTEYKSGIYSLMSTLLDSSVISSQVYAETKKDLLRQANDELKRQITAEKNSKESYSETFNSNEYSRGNDDIARAMAEAIAAAKYSEMDAGKQSYSISTNRLLIDYCNLLGPFYSEPTVKSFFDKAFKTIDNDFKISLINILLRNNQVVEDIVIDNLAKDIKTRLPLYHSLKSINKLEKIKPEYRTQNSLVKAMIFGDTEIPSDSIQFISIRYVESKIQKGNVYFYKSTNKEGDEVNLYFVAFQPKDSAAFVAYPELNTSKTIYANDDVQKMIDEICYSLSLSGRKRVKDLIWNTNDYDY